MPLIYRPSAPLQWSWLSIQGPDALDFLHRLTTVNVKTMKPGDGAPGFFLSPQGKVRGFFTLWLLETPSAPTAKTDFVLEFDAGQAGKWKTELMTVIDQFHFSEKFTLTDVTDLQCVWIFPESDKENYSLDANKTKLDDASGARLFHHGATDFGRAWVSAWGTSEQLSAFLAPKNSEDAQDNVTHEQIEQWRIHAARPAVGHELSENSNPLEIGLHEAIAGNKGCYPGQEVIEKIISLGSPARRLVKIAGAGSAPAVGEMIQTTDAAHAEVGQVTSVARTDQGFELLTLVRKNHAKECLEVTFAANPETRAKLIQIVPYN
jgi:folate-binding protein YgfZ